MEGRRWCSRIGWWQVGKAQSFHGISHTHLVHDSQRFKMMYGMYSHGRLRPRPTALHGSQCNTFAHRHQGRGPACTGADGNKGVNRLDPL